MATPDKPLEQMTAQERLELGRSRYKDGKFDDAIVILQTIAPTEDSPTYAEAQLSLGLAYESKGNFNKAINTWSNVPYNDNHGAYAWAQFRLGKIYYDKDRKNPAEAIKVWSNIPYNDNHEAYAWAQVGLGFAYHAQGKLAKAIEIWLNIPYNDNHEAYAWAWAQFGLGLAYAQDKLAKAIAAWSKIRPQNGLTVYTRAQLNLGKVYSQDKEKEKQAHDAYDNVRDFSYYKSERGFKILECPLEVRKNLHSLAENTDEVLNSLQIIPDFELKVAHYTRTPIAFNLFGDKKNDKNPSNFRLNTIRGVNDPTEGLVLGKYWDQQGIPETIHTNDTATFISCFTFNHDSLNQFRLYGKENEQEATGVSLVFKKEFFSGKSDAEFITGPSINSSNKVEQNKIDKSTLYRCIYLDPETGYWTLAQRDKYTFYHQHEEYEWEDYYELISKQEENIKKYLFDEDNENNSVLSILQSIFTESKSYNEEENQQIIEAVRFILLPLQYLVKHIAFQEEQECRIMYITHLHDEKIRHDWEKQWMYVEYEKHVLPHIDKIWLSPGAAKYQDFFRILLDKGENDNKVRISQNPFRNKE